MRGIKILPSKEKNCFILSGYIDAHIDFSSLQKSSQPYLILDVENITEINSVGVRKWIEGIQTLQEQGKTVEYRGCSEIFVNQCNYVPEFHQNVKIHSFQVLFICEECNEYDLKTFNVKDLDLKNLPPAVPCPSCGEAMLTEEVDVFNFILS